MDIKAIKPLAIFVGVGIAALILLATFFTIFIGAHEDLKCPITSYKPKPDYNSDNIASADFEALAKLGGFVTMNKPGSDPVYLPLRLNTLETEFFATTNTNKMELISGCGTLTFNISHYVGMDLVENMKFRPDDPKLFDECLIKGVFLSAKTGYHYSCKVLKTYNCQPPHSNIALNIFDLEYEATSHSGQYKNRQFKTIPNNCDVTIK